MQADGRMSKKKNSVYDYHLIINGAHTMPCICICACVCVHVDSILPWSKKIKRCFSSFFDVIYFQNFPVYYVFFPISVPPFSSSFLSLSPLSPVITSLVAPKHIFFPSLSFSKCLSLLSSILSFSPLLLPSFLVSFAFHFFLLFRPLFVSFLSSSFSLHSFSNSFLFFSTLQFFSFYFLVHLSTLSFSFSLTLFFSSLFFPLLLISLHIVFLPPSSSLFLFATRFSFPPPPLSSYLLSCSMIPSSTFFLILSLPFFPYPLPPSPLLLFSFFP